MVPELTPRDVATAGPAPEEEAGWEALRPRVLFAGGASRFGSVQIRCVQMARQLGCPWATDLSDLAQVPAAALVLVCVKPELPLESLRRLAGERLLLWDVNDWLPPELPDSAGLLCSTRNAAATLLAATGKAAHVIPHHHANLEGTPNPLRASRRVLWIGRPHWMPPSLPAGVQAVSSNDMSIAELARHYREADLCYNFRAQHDETPHHVSLNPGLKALNSMGFGLPSVSPPEPAYLELAADGTLVCDESEAPERLRRLCLDEAEYLRWRDRAIAAGREFHISRIAARYRSLLCGLARQRGWID